MKITHLKQRLRKERPLITVSLKMPDDVIDDLKNIAPKLGFSSYESLIRAYIGQGLRADMEKLDNNEIITTTMAEV